MDDAHLETPEEVWKPIPGFPGYEVSDQGRVQSFWTQYGKTKGNKWVLGNIPNRILKPSQSHGYQYVSIFHNGNRYGRSILRLVLLAFRGPCPPGMEACHEDGDQFNNRLYNLRWDTVKNNQHDKKKHGTAAVGEKHGGHKLTRDQVAQIRTMTSQGCTQKEIGESFNIPRAYVSEIVNHRKWKNI